MLVRTSRLRIWFGVGLRLRGVCQLCLPGQDTVRCIEEVRAMVKRKKL